MKNSKGTFVRTGQLTSEQICLSLLGMQMASVVNCLVENKKMFTDDVSDTEFCNWMKKYFNH